MMRIVWQTSRSMMSLAQDKSVDSIVSVPITCFVSSLFSSTERKSMQPSNSKMNHIATDGPVRNKDAPIGKQKHKQSPSTKIRVFLVPSTFEIKSCWLKAQTGDLVPHTPTISR